MSARATLAAALVVAALSAVLAGCGGAPGVPTVRVEPRSFAQRVTAEGWLAAETVTPISVPPQVKTSVRLAWMLPDASVVKAGDLVARFDGGTLEQALGAGQNAYDGARYREVQTESASAAERADSGSEAGKARLELDLAQRFGKHDDGVFSRHEILQAQIDEDLARDKSKHAEAKQTTQASRARSDLALLSIAEQQARLRIDDAKAGLAALEVRAPHAGLFTRGRDWMGEPIEVGAELWRGQPVGEIPDLSKLQAKVFVLEADAGGVAPGQRAEVALEARPELRLVGKVSRVDAVAKPREQGSPVQYFEVTVDLGGAAAGEVWKLGQRLRATLHARELDRALLVPRQCVEHKGDQELVYVRRGKDFVPRPVTLGPGSGGLVVVARGLAAGEVIALRPPQASPASPPDGAAPRDGSAPSTAVPGGGS